MVVEQSVSIPMGNAVGQGASLEVGDGEGIVLAPQPTGRRIVTFQEGMSKADISRLLGEATGSEPLVATKESLTAALRVMDATDTALVLDRLPVAVIGGPPRQSAAAANTLQTRDEVVDARPEFWMFALASNPPWADSANATWGLEACGVLGSQYDGKGIRIAILDTGIDLGHPDFAGKTIVTASFVASETIDDVQGHGTHCAGVAASGYRGGGNVPRYGVAPGAELFVGKVLNNRGAGREMDIIAGIEWAIGQGCEVISMSLGRAAAPNEAPDPLYEQAGRAALDAGCVIVAAAGNESDRRFNYVAPVGAPANSQSILAVAAIGADAGIASFSCGGVGVGQVDVCGPGVGIFSSVPHPQFYRKMSGTSMACPHIAGLAALLAQSDPALRGPALWQALVQHAGPLPGLPARDVGAGLVIAP